MRIVTLASVALILNLCAQNVWGTDDASAPTCTEAAVTPVAGAETAAGPGAVLPVHLASRAGVGSQRPGNPDLLPLRLGEDGDDPEIPDSTGQEAGVYMMEDAGAPFYRTWWFWSAVGGAVALAVVLGLAGGGDRGNLPDFPGPPER